MANEFAESVIASSSLFQSTLLLKNLVMVVVDLLILQDKFFICFPKEVETLFISLGFFFGRLFGITSPSSIK